MNERENTTSNAAGGATAARAKDTTNETQPALYSNIGQTTARCLNRRISEHGNVQITLGTKRVEVIELHADNRLEVAVPVEGRPEPERQFVAFDDQMFDQLWSKLMDG